LSTKKGVDMDFARGKIIITVVIITKVFMMKFYNRESELELLKNNFGYLKIA
jgi:hypothetical protein